MIFLFITIIGALKCCQKLFWKERKKSAFTNSGENNTISAVACCVDLINTSRIIVEETTKYRMTLYFIICL